MATQPSLGHLLALISQNFTVSFLVYIPYLKSFEEPPCWHLLCIPCSTHSPTVISGNCSPAWVLQWCPTVLGIMVRLWTTQEPHTVYTFPLSSLHFSGFLREKPSVLVKPWALKPNDSGPNFSLPLSGYQLAHTSLSLSVLIYKVG